MQEFLNTLMSQLCSLWFYYTKRFKSLRSSLSKCRYRFQQTGLYFLQFIYFFPARKTAKLDRILLIQILTTEMNKLSTVLMFLQPSCYSICSRILCTLFSNMIQSYENMKDLELATSNFFFAIIFSKLLACIMNLAWRLVENKV